MKDVTVMLFDTSKEHHTAQGAVYNNDAMVEAFKKFGELDHAKYVYVEPPEDGIGNLSEIAGVVKDLSFKDDGVWGNIQLLDTPQGKYVQTLMEQLGNKMHFVPDGYGRSIGDKVIDYEMASISIALGE